MNEAILEKNVVKSSAIGQVLYKGFKRIFDFTVALIFTIMLSPIFLILIVLIRLDSKGKAVFVQKRIGKNDKVIKIYKFRSMVENAEAVLEELMKNDPKIKEEYLTNKKLENDPRITKMGAILRKTSLDELPQIINILKGEMSLIGPRPYLPREREDMEGYMDYITAFRPGLTGMWQVSGRSDTTFEERLKFDKYYFEHFSFKLDAKIFIKTITTVIKKEGAK